MKIPNGDYTQQVAARHYYGADDRLMVVQRYSWRSVGVGDGTWEEYWYDALGRRILTRARREPDAIHPVNVSGPLCSGASSLCSSFTERVSWDGDQALVEARTPEGARNDASNNGVVRNIHGLTLDEPIAVVADSIRIINYNWRGQAMSSVFLDGRAGDLSLGNPANEIDWPAATQAETYFAASPDATPSNNPKRWLGTFVANGQGTTGMLYRRNRYFDPKSGQFTQADPTGIATGMNVFGFANGDPINFGDPFGLCVDCVVDAAAIVMDVAEMSRSGVTAGRMAGLAVDVAGAAIPGLASPGGAKLAAKVGETAFTKAGRSAHMLWDAGEGFVKEFTLPSGRRADAVNFAKRIVKELKPDNAKAVRRGESQVAKYAKELSEFTKETWKGVVETYIRNP